MKVAYDQKNVYFCVNNRVVKAGEGKKYIQSLEDPIMITPKKIVYSKANGEKKNYKFK